MNTIQHVGKLISDEFEGHIFEPNNDQWPFQKKLYTEDQMKELIEKCAIVAWNHYMDTCKQNNISPANAQIWCVAEDIRKNMMKVIS